MNKFNKDIYSVDLILHSKVKISYEDSTFYVSLKAQRYADTFK